MIDNILNDLLSWIANLITTVFDALSSGMLDTLKPQISTMMSYFPFLGAAQKAVVYFGYSLLFLIVVWQLFRSFAGPLSETENPLQLIARASLFAFLTGFSAEIFDILMKITLVPYNYFLNDVKIDASSFSFLELGEAMNEGLAVNFVTQAGAAVIDIARGSAVFAVIWIIMLFVIGWNYIKLLLEAVERYVLVGVLYFTSPLAFAAGASRSTSQVFKSWCRMVFSELLLLVMNVWFIRGFNTAVGKAVASGGIIEGGGGNMYLCMFMLTAFLHVGQNMDKYLATLGLNTAQTGQGLLGDVMIASRMTGGLIHAASSGNFFGNKSGNHKSAESTSPIQSISENLSFERAKADAMREDGVKRGGGGPLAVVQKAAAQIAVNNGAMVSAKAISGVANMKENEAGIMRGEGLNKSLGSFMPGLQSHRLSDVALTGGHIKLTATNDEGKSAHLELFSAGKYEAPQGPYSIVSDFEGQKWYQTAKGEAAGDFYDLQKSDGAVYSADEINAQYPDNSSIKSLRDVEDGVREAIDAEGTRSMMYSSAYFDEPEAPHETMTSGNGVEWYSVPQASDIPALGRMDAEMSEEYSDSGADMEKAYAGDSVLPLQKTYISSSENEESMGENSDIHSDGFVPGYARASFNRFMPGYEKTVSKIDSSGRNEGIIEVTHPDGTGTRFYNSALYAPPRGNYKVYEDSANHQWIAVSGKPVIETRPVFYDGSNEYDAHGRMITEKVSSVRYINEPQRFPAPQKRSPDKLGNTMKGKPQKIK